MDKGIINQELLEKNRKLIDFYSREEQKTLSQIYTVFLEVCQNYQSTNTPFFTNHIQYEKSLLPVLDQKRSQYTAVMGDVVARYNLLSNQVTQKFEGRNSK